jgi:transcriptional regulator with XRE-family HTH domain
VSTSTKRAREALGARLREIRQDANLTGRALASRCGWHFTKVSKVEHGTQNPSEDDLRAWCHACDAEDQVPDLIATVRAIESMRLIQDSTIDLVRPILSCNDQTSIKIAE